MNKRLIKKKLLEEKEKKENRLIESQLVENRLRLIVESKEKFNSLSKKEQKKVFFQLMQEMNTLDEQGLINEQFGDILSKLFGQSFQGIAQAFLEPMVSSILGSFGLKGFFNKFITSFIVSNPRRLVSAFKNCQELTKLIAEALSDALVMTIQQQQGLQGRGYDIIRNTLGGAIKDTEFIKSLERQMSDTVCKLFNSFSSNAGKVLQGVAGSSGQQVATQ